MLVGDGPLEAQIRASVDRLDLSARVRFAGYRRDIPAVLAASDALLLCSEREGLNRSALEAMAAGVPVIGTNTRGIADAIGGPNAGWIVDKDDAAALAVAIDEAAGDSANVLAAVLLRGSERSLSSRCPTSSTPTRSSTVKRSHRVYDAVKRILDVIVAAVLLIVLSPLLLVVAILVRCEARLAGALPAAAPRKGVAASSPTTSSARCAIRALTLTPSMRLRRMRSASRRSDAPSARPRSMSSLSFGMYSEGT